MSLSPEEFHTQLVKALAEYDELTRNARADRIIWLSSMPPTPPVVAGRLEHLELLEELRQCFIEGRYIAVLLTATALVEQTLVEELELRNDPGPRRNLGQTIKSAHSAGILSTELLDRADHLRQIRNPLGHYRPEDDPYTLVSRFRTKGEHPRKVLEEDAKHAVSVAYEMFVETLRYS